MQKQEMVFTKVGIKIYEKDGNTKEERITPDMITSTYPVIISTGKDLLMAYAQKKDIWDNSVIVVQRLSDFK